MPRDQKTLAPNLKIITDNFGTLSKEDSESIDDSVYSVVSSSVLSS